MSSFSTVLDSLNSALSNGDYYDEIQLLSYTYRVIQQIYSEKKSLDEQDKKDLLDFVFSALPQLREVVIITDERQKRDAVTSCIDAMTHIVALVCPTTDELDEKHLTLIRMSIALVESEQKTDIAVKNMFKLDEITEADLKQALDTVSTDHIEYLKAKLYDSIIESENNIIKMTPDAKAYFSSYLAADMRMCLSANPNEHALHILELGADLIRYLKNEELLSLLTEITEYGWNNVNCYAVRSLLAHNREISPNVISALAKDIRYAYMVYSFLKQHKKESLFPAECSSAEYLAKSDMVHWLCYPTELGKEPNEIEYIGAAKSFLSKEVYYVFKFCSDSDTLTDELNNKWLIGWASEEGGTFSNFDLYSEYEKKTPKATLKNIKKRLIG